MNRKYILAMVLIGVFGALLILWGCSSQQPKLAPPAPSLSLPARAMIVKQSSATIQKPMITMTALAANVRWRPSPDPGAVSYNVYYGPGHRDYTNLVPCSGTNVQIPGFWGGKSYYFAVTAVDKFGVESDFSDEARYDPLPAFALKFPEAGSALESSTDLLTWSAREAVLTNGVWLLKAQSGILSEFFREKL